MKVHKLIDILQCYPKYVEVSRTVAGEDGPEPAPIGEKDIFLSPDEKTLIFGGDRDYRLENASLSELTREELARRARKHLEKSINMIEWGCRSGAMKEASDMSETLAHMMQQGDE